MDWKSRGGVGRLAVREESVLLAVVRASVGGAPIGRNGMEVLEDTYLSCVVRHVRNLVSEHLIHGLLLQDLLARVRTFSIILSQCRQ